MLRIGVTVRLGVMVLALSPKKMVWYDALGPRTIGGRLDLTAISFFRFLVLAGVLFQQFAANPVGNITKTLLDLLLQLLILSNTESRRVEGAHVDNIL